MALRRPITKNSCLALTVAGAGAVPFGPVRFLSTSSSMTLTRGSPLRRRVEGVRRPKRFIALDSLIAPGVPTFSSASREQLQEWSRAACLDDLVLFVRFPAVFALASREIVDLTAARRQRAGVLSLRSK